MKHKNLVNKNRKARCLLGLYKRARKWGGVYKKLYFFLCSKLLCDIPLSADIGEGLRLPHPMGIVISPQAVIGKQCTIYHFVTIGVNEHHINYKSAPEIGEGVFIGAGAVIIGDIKIGDNVIIGANATVTKSVPNNSVVIGCNSIIKGKIERNPYPIK